MISRRSTACLVALALVTVGFPAAAGAHFAGLDANDVSNEPSTPADRTSPATNGFADIEDNQLFDLVLDGVVQVTENNPVAYNALLRGATAGTDAEAGPYVFPGLADFNTWWGWWLDKGTGGYLREAGAPGADGSPNQAIDDGADNHTADVVFSPEDGNVTGWRDTGPWDEFIWRGPNDDPQLGNLQYAGTSDDAPIATYEDDEMFIFVQPGTHASYFSTILGKEESGRALPRVPGYGVVSEGADGPRNPDTVCDFNDNPEEWDCVFALADDTSLLITTRVKTAVNPSTVSGGLKDIPSSDAVDTDVYTSVGAAETVYRTAVWDPGDHRNGTQDDVLNDEGPKDTVKHFYSVTSVELASMALNTTYASIDPLEPYVGAATDYALYPPNKHEPNEPGDSFPGAIYNPPPKSTPGGANYPGLNRGDKEWNDEYYNPNQTWKGYADHEQAFADFQQRTSVPFSASIDEQYGVNLVDPLSMDDQETMGPTFFSYFGHVGTWFDVTDDTWVGEINQTDRCTTYDEPYCNGVLGAEGGPNDYGHNPSNSLVDNPEWIGTCTADVTMSIRPVGTPARDVDGDGTEEHAWGTTEPPVGIYVLDDPIVDDTLGDQSVGGQEVTDDPGDDRRSNHVQYGPVNLTLGPDQANCKSGQWFPGDEVLLPTGTVSYPIKMKGTVEVSKDGLARGLSSTNFNDLPLSQRTVTDVDVVNSWT